MLTLFIQHITYSISLHLQWLIYLSFVLDLQDCFGQWPLLLLLCPCCLRFCKLKENRVVLLFIWHVIVYKMFECTLLGTLYLLWQPMTYKILFPCYWWCNSGSQKPFITVRKELRDIHFSLESNFSLHLLLSSLSHTHHLINVTLPMTTNISMCTD